MLSHLAGVFSESPILQVVWGCAVAGSVKGLALFGLAWVVVKLCRGLSSEHRHRIWLLVTGGTLAATLAWLAWPTAGLRVPVTVGQRLGTLLGALPFAGRGDFVEVMSVPGTQSVITDRAVRVLRRLLPYLLGGIWIAGALYLLQRLVIGRWLALRLLKRADPAPVAPELIEGLCRRLGLRRAVTVHASRQCGIPFTFGTFRPVVLLPEEAAAWPERRLRAVLIHELTHVRRKESLLNCLAACACALLWFLPVLWVSYSLMRQEAEASSDRAVLRHGISRTDYASDLVELAHGGRGVALAGGAAVALARRRNVRDRVVRILAWRRGTASRSLRAAGVAVTLAFLCVLPVLASSGAALVGDRPLVGAWISPESLRCRRIIWTADGRVIEYTLLDSDVPSGVGRYTIEKKWMDEQGSTWYQVKARVSPPPFRERIAWKNLYLIRVSPSGTSLEYDVSWFLDFLDTLTLGDDTVFLRESPR